MTNRREFLQIGVTATAWPIVAHAVHAAAIDPAPPSPRLFAVIYDPRFAESVAFAERSAAKGVAALAIEGGDMTRLWYDHLHPRWRQGPAAVAGLTAHGPMFCVEELARDVRMRVVFRAEHQPAPAGPLHAARGPVPMLTDMRAVCGRSRSLGAAMADVVARCPGGRHEIASASMTAAGALTAEEPLYTWLVAPAIIAR